MVKNWLIRADACRDRFIAVVAAQLGPAPGDQKYSQDAADSTADNGCRCSKELGHDAGFHSSEATSRLAEALDA